MHSLTVFLYLGLLASTFTLLCKQSSRGFSSLRLNALYKSEPSASQELINNLRTLKYDDRIVLLERVLSSDNIVDLEPGTVKTLLVASIDSESTFLLQACLSYLQQAGLLTSEIVYVGIYTSCQRNLAKTAMFIFEYSVQQGLKLDSFITNRLIQTLIRCRKLQIACDFLEKCHAGAYGNQVKADISTYSLLLDYAGRTKNTDAIGRTLKLIEQSGRMKVNEDTYLTALSVFAYSNDFLSALDVLNQYQKSQSVIQMRAYSLVLSAFIYNENVSAKQVYPDMDRVVSTLVRSGLDTSETIASLVLQYFCIRDDQPRADLYLKRLQSNGVLPNIPALFAYAKLVDSHKDARRASAFKAYLHLHGYTHFFSASNTSSISAAAVGSEDQSSVDADSSVNTQAILNDGVTLLMAELNRYRTPPINTNSNSNPGTSSKPKQWLDSTASAVKATPTQQQDIKLEWVIVIIKMCIQENQLDTVVKVLDKLLLALPRVVVDCVLIHSLVELVLTKMPYNLVQPYITPLIDIIESLTPTLYFSQRGRRKNVFGTASIAMSVPGTGSSRAPEVELLESLKRTPFRPLIDRSIKAKRPVDLDRGDMNAWFSKHAPEIFYLASSRMYRYYPVKEESLSVNDVSAPVDVSRLDESSGGYLTDEDSAALDSSFRSGKDEFRGIPFDASWKFFRSASYTLLAEMLVEVEGAKSQVAMALLDRMLALSFWPCRSVLRKLLSTILCSPESDDKAVAFELLAKFRAKGFVFDDSVFQLLLRELILLPEKPIISAQSMVDIMRADKVVLSVRTQKDMLAALQVEHNDAATFEFFQLCLAQAETRDEDVDDEVWEAFVASSVSKPPPPPPSSSSTANDVSSDSSTTASSIQLPQVAPVPTVASLIKLNQSLPRPSAVLSSFLSSRLMDVLLESRRNSEIKSLLEAVTSKSSEIHPDEFVVMMKRMLAKDNQVGATDLFDIALKTQKRVSGELLSLYAPVLEHMSQPLDVQRSRLNLIVEHIPSEYTAMSLRALNIYFRRACDLKLPEVAATLFHALAVNSDREGLASAQICKLCVDTLRPDLLIRLLDGWTPRRTVLMNFVGSLIASLSLSGFWKTVFHFEGVYVGELALCNKSSIRAAPWAPTFLLLSAAQGGQFVTAARVMKVFLPAAVNNSSMLLTDDALKGFEGLPIRPSELDYNLCLYAHLIALQKYVLLGLYEFQMFRATRTPATSYLLARFQFKLENQFVNSSSNAQAMEGEKGAVEFSVPDLVRDVVGLLREMSALGYGVHPRVKTMPLFCGSSAGVVESGVDENGVSVDKREDDIGRIADDGGVPTVVSVSDSPSDDGDDAEKGFMQESVNSIRSLLYALPETAEPRWNSFETLFRDDTFAYLDKRLNMSLTTSIDIASDAGLSASTIAERMKSNFYYCVMNTSGGGVISSSSSPSTVRLMECLEAKYSLNAGKRMKALLNRPAGAMVMFNHSHI